MKAFVPLVLLAALTASAPVLADYDRELEAEERAKLEAEQRAEAARQAENARIKKEAQDKADSAMMAEKRKYVGAAAKGKSDAEVNALYDAKIKKTQAEGFAAAARTQESLSSGQNAAALKQVTGKSMAEIQNMSDEELEAMAAEMEKKYGGK